MIQEAKAEHCRVKVVAFNVDFLNRVVDIVGKLRIVSAVSAAFVLVWWDVGSICFQAAQAISCDDLRC